MIEAGAITADFVSGSEYRLFADRERGHWVVEDTAERLVAAVPAGLGGEVLTRTDRWMIRPERRTIGWAVVARDPSNGAEAGRAKESLAPYTWKLHVVPDLGFRVTRVRGAWTIRHGGWRVARISDIGGFLGSPHTATQGTAGTIKTFESPPRLLPLSLVILLTLEMIVADDAVPRVDSGGGGG